MSSYCAISPTSSPPWVRRRATTSSMSSTANMMRRMRQRVRRCILRLGADRLRRVEHRQLDAAVAVRGPQHCDVLSDVVDPDDTLHPTSLDWPLALQLHAKFDEERNNSVKVVDNDEDVVHPLDRHAGSPWCCTATVAASAPETEPAGRSRHPSTSSS